MDDAGNANQFNCAKEDLDTMDQAAWQRIDKLVRDCNARGANKPPEYTELYQKYKEARRAAIDTSDTNTLVDGRSLELMETELEEMENTIIDGSIEKMIAIQKEAQDVADRLSAIRKPDFYSEDWSKTMDSSSMANLDKALLVFENEKSPENKNLYEKWKELYRELTHWYSPIGSIGFHENLLGLLQGKPPNEVLEVLQSELTKENAHLLGLDSQHANADLDHLKARLGSLQEDIEGARNTKLEENSAEVNAIQQRIKLESLEAHLSKFHQQEANISQKIHDLEALISKIKEHLSAGDDSIRQIEEQHKVRVEEERIIFTKKRDRQLKIGQITDPDVISQFEQILASAKMNNWPDLVFQKEYTPDEVDYFKEKLSDDDANIGEALNDAVALVKTVAALRDAFAIYMITKDRARFESKMLPITELKAPLHQEIGGPGSASARSGSSRRRRWDRRGTPNWSPR